MQLAMTDSIKFVDMMHNVPWEDGLPGDTREGRQFSIHVCLSNLHRCTIKWSLPIHRNRLFKNSRIVSR